MEKESDLWTRTLEKFCKDASRAFFKEWGLVSHQINSYNDFIEHGLQDLFDTIGEVVVEPGYDPSKKGSEGWRHAAISFGKVRFERPEFWPESNDVQETSLKLLPKHARLQSMTYSSQLKVEVRVQVCLFAFIVGWSWIFVDCQASSQPEVFTVYQIVLIEILFSLLL